MRSPPVPDQTITNQINRNLANRGVRSPCKVVVATKNGQVTLSGTVAFAHQKGTVASAVKGISGVRRVVDQLIVKPQEKR